MRQLNEFYRDWIQLAFISYPEKSTTKIQLSSLHPLLYIKMEEAIFTGLQKEGWFNDTRM